MDLQRVAVVLPAAGIGSRMNLQTPKQFCHLHNRPVISYTIQAFEKIPFISCIVVVVSEGQTEEMEAILHQFCHDQDKVHVTVGANTRHRSIYAGVKKVAQFIEEPEIVVIHDGVRPFVPETLITDVCKAAQEHGAAGCVRPLVSTVIAPDSDNFLKESLDRTQYRNSEMPQAFQYNVINTAYQKCTDYDFDFGTECLHLALKYSKVRAKLVEGSDCLWKVTHARDLHTASGFLRDQINHIHIYFEEENEILQKSISAELLEIEGIKKVHSNLLPLSTFSLEDSSIILLKTGILDGVHIDVLKSRTQSQRETGSIVYIMINSEKDLSSMEEKMKIMSRKTKCCVYGVVLKNDDLETIQQACPLLISLLKDKNKVLSGQTFKI